MYLQCTVHTAKDNRVVKFLVERCALQESKFLQIGCGIEYKLKESSIEHSRLLWTAIKCYTVKNLPLIKVQKNVHEGEYQKFNSSESI
jgi:hypothetical protein